MKVIDINSELYRLIDLSVKHDRQSQKLLYNMYAPKLLSTCRQFLDDIYHAEDVMITAFMKIFSNLSAFEGKGNFEAWIRRIAVNECISYIRANKKIQFADDDQILSFNATADMDLFAIDIQNMVDKLPVGCKMVFNLFAIEGYKHQEIAELLNINEGTSKSQMAYARKLLQQMLELDNIVKLG